MNGIEPPMSRPPVRIGMRVPHDVLGRDAAELAPFLAEVEAAGIDAVSVGDHVSFRGGRGYDGLIQATALAVASRRLSVWTAVYLLALRHPVPVARQVSSLAALAPGRFVFGVGLGGDDRHEVEVCGVDPRRRGRRLDESLAMVRALLAGETVSSDGPEIPVRDAVVLPAPAPPVPIVVGGRSDAALARAARHGDGWIGVWLSPQRAAAARARVEEEAAALGRVLPEWRHTMLVWCGFGPTAEQARVRVAAEMEALYQLPFSAFERYVAIGTPDDVAAAIVPYVDAGCVDVLVMGVPSSGDPADLIGQVSEVKRSLIA